MFEVISNPGMSQTFPITRLFKALDTLRKTSRAIWISGPPGAGKTALISDYLAARNIDSTWYGIDDKSLNPEDNASAACRKSAVRFPEDLLARTLQIPEIQAGNEFAVIFEDYHQVPKDIIFHEMLAKSTGNFPPNVAVIFISRKKPPPGFARMQAHGRMGFIGWGDLRLRPEESAAILSAFAETPFDPASLKESHDLTAGWLAGLVFLKEYLKTGIMAEMRCAAMPREVVFEYLAREVFDTAGADVRHFLMHTAFLPKMTAETAASVSGKSDGERLPAFLHDQNLFTERDTESPSVYTYHPLFREFLISRAEKHYPQEKLTAIKQVSAALLEEAGMIEDSAELCIQIGNTDALCDLIRKHAPCLIADGGNRILERWIVTVCPAIRANTPILQFWLGICRIPYDPAGARLEVAAAFDGATDADPLKVLAWSSIIDTYCLEWNDFHPLDYWIEWMENALAGGLVFQNREIEARAAAGMSAALMIRQPHHREIDAWAERCLALMHELPDIASRVQKFMFLAIFYFWRGDLARFRFVRGEIQNLASQHEIPPLSRLVLPCIDVFIDIWIEGNYETALEKTDHALSFAEETGVLAWKHMFMCLKAYCLIVRGDIDLAEKALSGVSELLGGTRKHLYCQYYYLQAWCSYLKDDKRLAKVQADAALAHADQTGYEFARILCLIQNAWITHGTEAPWPARDMLARARDLSRETGSLVMTYAADIIEAGFCMAEGRARSGIDRFKRAMALGRKHGYITPPWWCEPPLLEDLCNLALRHDIETDHVTEFVYKQRMVVPPPEDRLLIQWPWPVRIYTLGRFELFLWGKPVSFSGKVQKKPLEMLKALIALGGENIRKEQIADILWPDADGDMAQQSFSTTLHRLRQLLGEKQGVLINEGWIDLNPRLIWTDALFLLRHAARFERNWPDNPDPEILRDIQNLLDLYKGPFLEEIEGRDWTSTIRMDLRRKCLGLLERIGKFREREGKWRQAVACYERAVEIDPLAEAFYLYLMDYYTHTGRSGEAFRTYEQCRRNFRNTLGIDPSRAIYNKLKAVLS